MHDILADEGIEHNMDYFIQIIVSNMDTWLVEPDELIIKNLASGEDTLYVIAKGECKAIVLDNEEEDQLGQDEESSKVSNLKCWEVKDEYQDDNINLLRPGHYFGEIAVVFSCERTA